MNLFYGFLDGRGTSFGHLGRPAKTGIHLGGVFSNSAMAWSGIELFMSS